MPDTPREVIKSRAESHSDVAGKPASRAYQSALAERQFAELLIRRLRGGKGELHLRNFQEEWISTDDGLVYEISAEVSPGE